MLQQEMNHIFRMWMCFQIIILKYVKIYNPKSTQNVLNAFLLILQNCREYPQRNVVKNI